MRDINPRKIAIDILFDALEKNIKTNSLLNNYCDHKYFNFINNLVDTTIRNLILIDHIIENYTSQNLSQKKFLNLVLRCIICEIYFIKTPEHAIFYEWIEIIKKNKNFSNLSGAINAILHKLLKDLPSLDNLKILKQEKTISNISIVYSVPKWILEDFNKSYSLEEIESIFKFFNKIPDTTIRLNTDLFHEDKIIKFLGKDKIIFNRSKYFNDVLHVKKFPKAIRNLSTYNDGFFYIQDEASITYAKYISPILKSGAKILDATCGPGGKLSAIYNYSDKTQSLAAWDPSKAKTTQCLENFSRLKIKNILPKNLTITKLPVDVKKRYKNYFDYIFLDPPCSGFGSIRRKPQIKFSQTPENINALIVKQRDIFKNALPLLKKEGLIFWSLCTFNRAETFENINYILDNFKEVILIDFPKINENTDQDFIKNKLYFTPSVSETKTDYIFGAIFKKLS